MHCVMTRTYELGMVSCGLQEAPSTMWPAGSTPAGLRVDPASTMGTVMGNSSCMPTGKGQDQLPMAMSGHTEMYGRQSEARRSEMSMCMGTASPGLTSKMRSGLLRRLMGV